MCDFTGTKTRSDAAPGRCTKTSGYLALAEIIEIIKRSPGGTFQTYYDVASQTDVLLYKGWPSLFMFHHRIAGGTIPPRGGHS
jgi:hypothetical protein